MRCFAAIVLLLMPLAAVALDAGEKETIHTAVVRQADAWNAHDARAYAALFSEDCDVVNVVGWWWRGRAELEAKLATAFTQAFRDSRLVFADVTIRELAPGVALAHARWTMSGAKMPPGMPEPKEGIQTLTLVRQNDRWLISGFQNTLSIPECAFPASPPSPRGVP
jgi:uncharacterized protein (TIGR02246 family)